MGRIPSAAGGSLGPPLETRASQKFWGTLRSQGCTASRKLKTSTMVFIQVAQAQERVNWTLLNLIYQSHSLMGKKQVYLVAYQK